MIGSLRGLLIEKEAHRVLVEVGGVGYRVHVALSTFFALGEVGSEAVLRIHTHVREDALQLYGFSTELEQAVFERLIEVSGIGPRMAITILSGIPPAELVAAIRENDVKRLTQVPGVGRRLSERLVVELREKLDALALSSPAPRRGPASRHREDAVSALVNLGYRARDAEAAVDRVGPDAGDLEHILKAALALLAR